MPTSTVRDTQEAPQLLAVFPFMLSSSSTSFPSPNLACAYIISPFQQREFSNLRMKMMRLVRPTFIVQDTVHLNVCNTNYTCKPHNTIVSSLHPGNLCPTILECETSEPAEPPLHHHVRGVVIWWQNAPHRLIAWASGLQLVSFFWKVMEPLKGRTWVEGVDHWGPSTKVYNPALLTALFFLTVQLTRHLTPLLSQLEASLTTTISLL